MNSFQEKYHREIQEISLALLRSELDNISWETQLIEIKGARGVGKTTFILQYIKKNLPLND